ncbi:MAG: hypothetical protein AUG91_09285 [Actinobacteria bacterium 13_1_20CM_4_69_9]|nr:MAG: hypothetical protein AUG91_09285 [Actinobacteria bacterium 13_1_20CM_4_69_9]
MVQHERRADHRDAPEQRALELERASPTLRRRGLEQRVGAGGAEHLGARGADERRRPAVQHRLRSGHDDDEVRVHERRVDAQGQRAHGPELHEVVAFDVVHLDVAVEATRELR